jgi:uncharacterized membrane protein
VADKVAAFWRKLKFIILLVFSFGFDTLHFLNKGFDPYRLFIEFDFIMSCRTQAPVIMMSQNRQEEKDRERAKHMINLKSELEIRIMKTDHLIMHQQEELIEIQKYTE